MPSNISIITIMGFNEFPCYLGVILPSTIHHTRVGNIDWFEYLESISVSPVQEQLSNGDILVNMQHKCSKDKMNSIFQWVNKCIDERRQQYPMQYQKGLLIVLHKDDWKLFQDRGFSTDLKMCEDRPTETSRLADDCYCFYVERDNLERIVDCLNSHYSMHYSFGAKCSLHTPIVKPVPTTTGGGGGGGGGWSVDLSRFGLDVKITDSSGLTGTPSQGHHTGGSGRPLPVYVDQNAPNAGFNSFDCYLGFALPATLHHTKVRGVDWFKHFEAASMNPKHQHLTGGSNFLRNDILLSVIHQCDRKQIGNAINWVHECVDNKLSEYSSQYQNGLVIVMLRHDWKIWKSKMNPNEKVLSDKCTDLDRNRIGHYYVGRYVTLQNLDRFVTSLANHYSSNYQVGMKPIVERPEPSPSSHKKGRQQK